MEGRTRLKIGRKEAHLEVRRSKVKVSRLINAEMENAPYVPKGRPMNFKLGTGMEYNHPYD